MTRRDDPGDREDAWLRESQRRGAAQRDAERQRLANEAEERAIFERAVKRRLAERD